MPPPRPPRWRWASGGLLAPPPLLLLVLLLAATAAIPASSPRAVASLNEGWRFSRTDGDSPSGDCVASLPCTPYFDDAAWRVLALPHDFVVEAPLVYAKDNTAKNQGYRDYGKGWYRLRFSLPAQWSQGRRSLWLAFDGIAGYVGSGAVGLYGPTGRLMD